MQNQQELIINSTRLYKTLQAYKIELYKTETSQIDNNSVMTGDHFNHQQRQPACYTMIQEPTNSYCLQRSHESSTTTNYVKPVTLHQRR